MRHHAVEGFHILQQDVAVDVGEDNVEDALYMGEDASIAQQDVQIHTHPIEDGIVTGIVGAELVDIVSHNLFGTAPEGYYAEDACATTAVEDAAACQGKFEQGGDYHTGGLVVARAKGVACQDAYLYRRADLL